ncbi:hypothetical protein J6590_016115 [Homalodisca vitripennis]|nr:hypothetical protein J6590_016115 [Homalodisca vitripennis]
MFIQIRLVLIAVGGVLTQARFVLSALPLYSTILWLCDSPATTSEYKFIQMRLVLTQARFVLSALSLYSTILWLCDSPATTSEYRFIQMRLVLTQAWFVLSALSLYSTILWLCDSPATTSEYRFIQMRLVLTQAWFEHSSVRLTPKSVTTEQFVLQVTPVQCSWWQTVKACMPLHMSLPPPVHWGQLCWHLLTGRLVYPV